MAADEEAAELVAAAGDDEDRLEEMVTRRSKGEPLAWIVGSTTFAGGRIAVASGVYVPRRQTEVLVAAALAVLPAGGRLVDLCTGSGAVAAAVSRARPAARVVATDVDPAACACARRNGVDAYEGDLDEPLPPRWVGQVDVVTSVPPYVPTDHLVYLPRDVLAYEPVAALDGGSGGTDQLERVVAAAARLLRAGGWLAVELGADQDVRLAAALAAHRFSAVETFADEEGDLRALRARAGAGI